MILERFIGNRKIIESDSVYLYNPDDDLVLSFLFKELGFDVKISFSRDFMKGLVGMKVFARELELDAETRTNVKNGTIGTVNPLKNRRDGREDYLYSHMGF
ncbi:hypothetical protein C823_000684 [Eubacterium plexicaudatum ASF492]|uniref:Uncharacterized protein n=1 Tax=Eubacterium plexicaudatum ASF492 TaxID=1235802 RepID=N2A3U1_9FIRM|nr:hypothetical protein C823_000684 [Eubacterium plexicaudatum ASF492]